MLSRYFSLSILLSLVSLIRLAWPGPAPAPVDHTRVLMLARYGDAESRLALGRPIPLSTAGVYELELIPGISDKLATEILRDRPRILRRASRLPAGEKFHALEIVHGIGEKGAREVGTHLSLE